MLKPSRTPGAASMILVLVFFSAVAGATRPQLEHDDLLEEGGPLPDVGRPPMPGPVSASSLNHPLVAPTLQDSRKEHLTSVTSRNRGHNPSHKMTAMVTPSAHASALIDGGRAELNSTAEKQKKMTDAERYNQAEDEQDIPASERADVSIMPVTPKGPDKSEAVGAVDVDKTEVNLKGAESAKEDMMAREKIKEEDMAQKADEKIESQLQDRKDAESSDVKALEKELAAAEPSSPKSTTAKGAAATRFSLGLPSGGTPIMIVGLSLLINARRLTWY